MLIYPSLVADPTNTFLLANGRAGPFAICSVKIKLSNLCASEYINVAYTNPYLIAT